MRGHAIGPLGCLSNCSKDHRTTIEKLEDVVSHPSASDGEKRNAQAALDRIRPVKAKPTGIPLRMNHNYTRTANRAEWTLRSDPPPWTQRDAARVFNKAQREYAERLSRMSLDEITAEFERIFGAPLDDPVVEESAPALCQKLGHLYEKIGSGVTGSPIKRCMRCGKYYPSRPHKHDARKREAYRCRVCDTWVAYGTYQEVE